MTLSEMLSLAQFRLGNKTHLNAQIISEIKFAQNSLERDPKLNLWFMFRSWAFQAYIGERTYPLPNNFIKMAELYQPFFQTPENAVYNLTRKPAHLVFRPTSEGIPEFYGLEAQMFITDKEADGVYRIFYYASDDELALTTLEENNWTRMFPNILVLRAVMNVAKTLRDGDLFNFTKAEYDVEYKNLFDMCVAQEDVGYDISRGEFTDA